MAFDSGELVFDTLLLLFLVALVARTFAWGLVRRLLASGWPTTPGRIEFGNVIPQRTRYKDLYKARLDYSYTVNNEYYAGYYEKLFVWETAADRFVEGMKGQMVFIRYKAEKPERSALSKEDQLSWPK
ncbi:MAG: DUF3592 domain-containing protein [Acidobacteriia bacterium]|nr:DUF3592 domain-containing protein [Terriglobia bacterium]